MVFTNRYSKEIIEKFINFKNSASLKSAIDLFSRDDCINIHAIFSGLSWYVINELIPNAETISQEELDVYNYIEILRKKNSIYPENSDEGMLDNAVCTCFLENLLNSASSKKISYERFVPYLGEKSIEYCKAWDKFTGVRSPGIWTDEEWSQSQKNSD